MADDITQNQTQTTTETTPQPVVPPAEQSPVETPPSQPIPEQPTNPVSSETPNIPNFPNPEPQQSESQPAETKTETPTPTETVPPVSPPVLDIPALHYPFSGNFPVTFSFGQQSDNEEIKKKFQEWGITGHNGLDFGLSFEAEVFPCDSGKVIQSGENGDFGISITIQHSWGQSLYAHLSESKVKVDDEIQVNKVIGLFGASGSAFGEHLYFAIKPNNPDANNGYLGFIDPSSYLFLPSQEEETKQEPQTSPVEEQKPPEQPPQETKPPEVQKSEPVQEQPKPENVQQPPVEEVPPINYGPEKQTEPAQQPQQPENPQTPEVPQPNPEEIQRQVDEKLKTELDLRRQKANQARQTKREEHLMAIEKLIEEKKQINNQDVCDLLHVSQSTATNYLTDLTKRGTVKITGKGKATTYSY